MSKKFLFSFILLSSVKLFAGFNVQTLKPVNSWSYTLLEDSLVSPMTFNPNSQKEQLFFNFQFNSITSPLTQFDATGGNGQDIVARVSSLDIQTKWQFSETWGLSNDFSLNSVQINGRSEFSLGDTRFQIEKSVFNPNINLFGLSILGGVTLPIGDSDKMLSNNSFGAELTLVAEKYTKWANFVFNLGYLEFGSYSFRTIDYSKLVKLGLGTEMPLNSKLDLNFELLTSYLPHRNFEVGPGDLYFGGRYSLTTYSKIFGGVSMGEVEANGSSNFRFIVGYRLYPWREEKENTPAVQKIVTHNIVEKVINKVDRCDDKRTNYKFQGRPLTFKEKSQFETLPFNARQKLALNNIDLGQGTVEIKGKPIALDSQILFAFDFTGLPSRLKVSKVISAKLKLEMNWLNESQGDSLLCFLKQKLCSGEIPERGVWGQSLNEKFFQGKETPNDHYLKKRKLSEVNPSNSVHSAELILEVSDLIKNSLITDPITLIYDSVTGEPETIYLLVSGDVYLSSDTSLELSLLENRCEKSEESIE